jgi:hypothetical protein
MLAVESATAATAAARVRLRIGFSSLDGMFFMPTRQFAVAPQIADNKFGCQNKKIRQG